MIAAGNKPPMMVPARGIYMNKDLPRTADYFGSALASSLERCSPAQSS